MVGNHPFDAFVSSTNNNNDNTISSLYGRRKAIEELHQAYQRCCRLNTHGKNGTNANHNHTRTNYRKTKQKVCEMVLISGEAGSGKTALARSLQALVQKDGGLFGTGKFDCTHHQETPHNNNKTDEHNNRNFDVATSLDTMPLIHALAEWIHQIVKYSRDATSQRYDADIANYHNHHPDSLLQSIRQAVSQQLCEESHELLRRLIPGYTDMVPRNNSRQAPSSNRKLMTSGCSRASTEEEVVNNYTMIVGETAHSKNMDLKVILSKFITAMTSSAIVSTTTTTPNNVQVFFAPWVLFLDDLQWADDLTLDILRCILTDNNNDNHQQHHHLLIVGTFRSDEVSCHAFFHVFDVFKETTTPEGDEEYLNCNVVVTPILLSNLTELDIQDMVSDATKCSDDEIICNIARDIYCQTKGNALSVRQAVNSILDVIANHDCDQNHLESHYHENEAFSVSDAHQLSSTCTTHSGTNFVPATAQRMQQYEPYIRNQLMVAATLGNQFTIDVWLAAIADLADTTTDTGCIVASTSDYVKKNALMLTGHLETRRDDEDGSVVVLQWQNGLTWQAAYSLIPDGERTAWHLSIGRKLLHSLPPSGIDENIYLIISQFSHVAELTTDLNEKILVARLCLQAGMKAAFASSFQTAATCLNLGISILNDDDGWSSAYDLCLSLHNRAAEASFCVADLDRMDHYLDSVLRNAKSYNDTLQARTFQMYTLGSRGRQVEAYNLGMKALTHLGLCSWRKKAWVLDYCKMVKVLRRKKDRTLLSLPFMKDEKKLASMSIIHILGSVCTNCRPQLLPFLTTSALRLTIKYGLCPASSQAFLWYGLSRLLFGKRRESFRFGQLGLNVVEMLNAKEFLPKSYHIMYTFINPWNRPLRDSIEPLLYASCAGLETGDIDTAVKCRICSCRLLLWSGTSLSDVQLATTKSLDIVNQYKHEGNVYVHKPFLQFCENLMIKTDNHLTLSGSVLNQDEAYQMAQETNNSYLLVDLPLLRTLLAVYFNNYEVALGMATECKAAIKRGKILYFVVCLLRFYEGVAAIARVIQVKHNNNFKAVSQERLVMVARKNLKKLKNYARDAPENCQNKVMLLEALLEAHDGNTDSALTKLEQSMKLAEDEGFLHEQALACEFAGNLLLRRNYDFRKSKHYFLLARELYQRWGAHTKVRQMEQKYNLGNCAKKS